MAGGGVRVSVPGVGVAVRRQSGTARIRTARRLAAWQDSSGGRLVAAAVVDRWG